MPIIPSEFEWDEDKRRSNIELRGMDFVGAIEAFADPNRKIWEDQRNDYGEARFNMLACVANRVTHVTFTWRGQAVRIISYRKANDRECHRYGR